MEEQFELISAKQIQDELHPVSYRGHLYHVPSSELDRILEHGAFPSYALSIIPCENAHLDHNPKLKEQRTCDRQEGCFKGLYIHNLQTLRGLANSVRKDRVIAQANSHLARKYIGTEKKPEMVDSEF